MSLSPFQSFADHPMACEQKSGSNKPMCLAHTSPIAAPEYIHHVSSRPILIHKDVMVSFPRTIMDYLFVGEHAVTAQCVPVSWPKSIASFTCRISCRHIRKLNRRCHIFGWVIPHHFWGVHRYRIPNHVSQGPIGSTNTSVEPGCWEGWNGWLGSTWVWCGRTSRLNCFPEGRGLCAVSGVKAGSATFCGHHVNSRESTTMINQNSLSISAAVQNLLMTYALRNDAFSFDPRTETIDFLVRTNPLVIRVENVKAYQQNCANKEPSKYTVTFLKPFQ